MLEMMDQNEQENKALSSLRDLLLPKLIKGEIETNQMKKQEV